MVSVYSIKIDITSHDPSIDETEFRQLTDPCLDYLRALKGAFDKKPIFVKYYPPNHEKNVLGWSLQCMLNASVGKERGKNLMNFYPLIPSFFQYELPQFEIDAEFGVFDFS